MNEVKISDFDIGLEQKLTIIAGPCVIENEEMILHTVDRLSNFVANLPLNLIFKTSYKKANRTSISGFTGLEFTKSLEILEKIKTEYSLPVLTDVHTDMEVPVVAEVVDVLQIPAFLCRQTDLLQAAGRTGKPVNVKKGQFLSPGDFRTVTEKIRRFV